mmetsp:Transcript_36587/g.77818  ORF Transcript_36587/g.77818 Transcript_36587/m.77818 type:complete len:561 (-) Transcript_36587:114-1796(-)|eukprot:CAMPEP_0206466454 /NCGR_PEP_ID=MMETSP0324_2-20121206/28464_1 /ASSEMBLY_ACC=CAM_ASM_000836 /TAXON_ID=2866 /ORGANISM="Crypthecodinium cohnii, Strain Seligo" /LENGTH=560 /DNA_ID=CAMNT_0053939565 /DNA_START=43 /DNA_END=1725 /DNA_ORIENTATION=+
MEAAPPTGPTEDGLPEVSKDPNQFLRRRTTTANLAAGRPRPLEPGGQPRLLLDPLNDRQVQDVPRPAAELLVGDSLWDEEGLPRLDVLDQHLGAEGLLSQELILELIGRVQEKFLEEPNLIQVQDPVTVVGDIHGQFYDMRTLIEVGGSIHNTQYLFLGDYVDRGSFSVEVVTYLFAVKLAYPKNIIMLRGNHESRQMTNFFNFHEECEFKYDNVVYDAIMEAFDAMPIAALINGQFLALHGGLSPELTNFRQINKLDRVKETPRSGVLCDLLWSDPSDETRAEAYAHNTNRGCAYHFSMNSAFKFLADNKLLSIFRAHEVQKEGFKFHKSNPKTQMPGVITIFSAPNYCDAYGNRGAVMRLDNNTLNLKQYNFIQHPYHLTNFMTVFEWSLPFVAEQVLAVLEAILAHTEADADGSTDDATKVDEALSKATERPRRPSLTQIESLSISLALELNDGLKKSLAEGGEGDDTRKRMQQKVRAVARMVKVCKQVVEKHRTVISLKGVCPGDRLSVEQLLEGQEAVKNETELFELAANLDSQNEMRPDKIEEPGNPGSPTNKN